MKNETSNTCIAVFGSKVDATGEPSGSLQRLVSGALAPARGLHCPTFFVTGGSEIPGKATEAAVMTRLLIEGDIDKRRIIRDDVSTDTLESDLCAADRLRPFDRVIACSDRYHVLRITCLLRLLDIPAAPGWIESGRTKTGTFRWIYMWIRDLAALLYDVAVRLIQITVKDKGND